MTLLVSDLLATVLSACAFTLTVEPRHHHHHRRHHQAPPMHTAVASWYDVYGITASGVSYTYGFASLLFGSEWGKRILFCHNGRCQVGRLDDHGPYVTGREFDLSPPLRNAINCPDLCTVQWRPL